jgi:GNAT superfamily N-acetyltransferase
MKTKSDLEIRAADIDDLSSILELYAQPSIDDGRRLAKDKAETIFHRITGYPNYKIYIALLNGKVVGTFALLIMDNLGHLGAPSGIVEDVAVDPDCQGRGIGRAMMQHAMQSCREAGCYKLSLSSNLKREQAHRFYKSLGFNQHGYSFLIDL